MAKPRPTTPKKAKVVLDEIEITADAPNSPVSAYGNLKQGLYDKGSAAIRAMTPGGMLGEFERTQQPYEQFKFMAKTMGGPLKAGTVSESGFKSLKYDEAKRLRDENVLSEEVFQQYLDYSDTLPGTGAVSVEEMYKSPNLSRAED
jgi:hypothetical protein